MPTITPVKFELTTVEDHNRSGGVHLSDITRDIGFTMGYIPPEYMHSELNPEIINIGLALEDFTFPRFHPDVDYHPGEMMLDGISGTADGISWFDSRTKKVHEGKTTRKSMRKELDLTMEWLWMAQTASYCKMWDTNLARYHIWWLNGDYRRGQPSANPHYKLYDLEFTKRELDDNWQMILNRGRSHHGVKGRRTRG